MIMTTCPPLPPPQKKKTVQDWFYASGENSVPSTNECTKIVLAFHPQIYFENTHPTHNFYDNAFQVDVNVTF